MKFRNTLLFIGTFFGALTFLPAIQAQSNLPNSGTMEAYVSMGDVQLIQSLDLRYQGVKGTPFVYEDWTEGYVLFKGKEEEEPKTFKMNINMIDNNLYVVLYDGKVGPLPIKFVQSVYFNTGEGIKQQFMPMPRKLVEDMNTAEVSYYQVIYQGDIWLVKHNRKTFKEADFKGAYSADIRYDEYKDDTRYFLSLDGQSFEKIKLKSKDLEKSLPGYADEIKSISKKENLNLSNEADVAKLFTLLEQK